MTIGFIFVFSLELPYTLLWQSFHLDTNTYNYSNLLLLFYQQLLLSYQQLLLFYQQLLLLYQQLSLFYQQYYNSNPDFFLYQSFHVGINLPTSSPSPPPLQARGLREQLQNALADAEDEHRRRVSSEVSLSRDLADTERKYTMKLRRANSLHDMDKVHLRQDLDRLYHALRREKYTNKYWRDYRHHFYCGHHDCVDCVYDPMLLD